MEIERKFRVNRIPDGIEKCEKDEIEQGYLCIKPTVRIRKINNKYTLNYKWKNKNVTEQKAIQNIEYEMPLTKENYEHLYHKVDNYMIIKTRYKIQINENLIAEVDVFHGNLEGLIFAEVEFPNIEIAENFVQPEWMGEDISFDKRYDNTLLSKLEAYDEKYFK